MYMHPISVNIASGRLRLRNEDVPIPKAVTKSGLPRYDECAEMHRLCLSMNLRRTERLITAHYDAYLSAAHLTAVQLPILASIASAEEPTFRALSEQLDLDRSTLSRNLALLEERGLVTITAASGRRPGRLSLTRKGRATLTRAYRLWLEAHDALENALSPPTVADGLQLLRTLRQAARRVSAERGEVGGG